MLYSKLLVKLPSDCTTWTRGCPCHGGEWNHTSISLYVLDGTGAKYIPGGLIKGDDAITKPL